MILPREHLPYHNSGNDISIIGISRKHNIILQMCWQIYCIHYQEWTIAQSLCGNL